MIELNVPFLEKEDAKRLGARWNPASKRWYVPSGVDPKLFIRWLSADILATIDENVTVAENIALTEISTSISTEIKYSLANFLTKVSDVLRTSFQQAVWVSAEISELRDNKGNIFITLVEHDEQGNMIARSNARIWQSQAGMINAKFKQGTGSELVAGIKVLLLTRVEFHPHYGFALFIEDIDPNYTLGDMAAKIAKIREVLIKEKIYEQNKQIPKPNDFVRVAVISPSNAAGLGDFNREADLLRKYKLCEFNYFTAIFQGEAAAGQISAAITKVIAEHKVKPFDALVIIRGGGAISDLAWLNQEQLARDVCLCPIHVMVGIGHERDFTILDEVAGERFDTPSKVSNRIFNVIVNNATTAENNYAQILKYAKHLYEHTLLKVDSMMKDIKQAAKSALDRVLLQITNIYQQIGVAGNNLCNMMGKQIQALITEILTQSPKNILSKGFVLVTNQQGKVISSSKIAAGEDKLQLEFYDGKLDVVPVENE